MQKKLFNTMETMISTQIRQNNKKVGVAGAGLALVTLGVSTLISKNINKKTADEMLDFAKATGNAITEIKDVVMDNKEAAGDKNELLKNINNNLERQTAVFEQLNFIVNGEEDEEAQPAEDEYGVIDASSKNAEKIQAE